MFNILIISHSYPSQNGPSNQIFIKQQIEKLVDIGYNITVIATYGKRLFPFSIAHRLKIVPLWSDLPFDDKKGLDVHRIYVPILPKKLLSPYYDIILGPMVLKYIRSEISHIKFDLIHSHIADYGGFIGSWISKKIGVPFIITSHGNDTDVVIHRSKIHKKKIQKCLRSAKRVICVSKKVQKSVQELGITEVRTTIVRNGINIDEINSDPDFLKDRFGDRTIILSVSHLLKTKGIQYNLYALHNLIKDGKDVFYVIVGDGPYRKKLEKYIQDMNIESNVSFEGLQEHKDVMRYMSACDIFSMPSWQESFGIVYIEAMLNAKPAIGIQSQGISEIMTHNETGFLVKPHDVDDLSNCIRFLIDNPDHAKTVGKQAKEFVIKNLKWNQSAHKLSRIYHQVIYESRLKSSQKTNNLNT